MKKQLCALLAAMLFVPGALAEGAVYAEGTDALLKNPRDAYEFFMDETDGSDQLVFMMLDSQNDEETLAVDGTAVTYSLYEVSADGALTLSHRVFAFQTDYGKVIRMDAGTDDPALYFVGAFLYKIQSGAEIQSAEYGLDTLESMWSSACFPGVSEMTLNTMRQDEDGANYYLITGGDGCEYEYKTDAANRIEEMRIYAPDGDDFVLDIICFYGTCEAPALPDQLVDALNAE